MSRERKRRGIAFNTVVSEREARFRKSQKPMIGIDIGSSTVKMVQMKKNSRIAKWGMEQIPGGMLNQGRIETPVQLAEVIKRAASKNKIKGRKCSLCLSSSELIVRELRLPEMKEEQIIDNIKHEINSLLPLNHEEYNIDYKVLEYIPSDDDTPGKLRLMVAAIPNSLIRSYINTLKKANLKVSYIDVAPNIAGKMIKWISVNNNSDSNFSNIGIVDFGAHTTNIIILKDGNYFIHKTIANGGDYLTSLIAEKLNMDYMEAEALKRRTNFFDKGSQDIASQYVKNFIDYLITDIERTIEFYKNRNNQKGLDKIYIIGGGCLLKGLNQYMKEHLYIEVSLLSEAMQNKKGNDYDEKIAAFSQAIGATMREE